MSISTFLRSSDESREPAKRWQLRGDLSSNRHFRSSRKTRRQTSCICVVLQAISFCENEEQIGAYARFAMVCRANEAATNSSA
jgi:hypothetical protein